MDQIPKLSLPEKKSMEVRALSVCSSRQAPQRNSKLVNYLFTHIHTDRTLSYLLFTLTSFDSPSLLNWTDRSVNREKIKERERERSSLQSLVYDP